jgi:hypothetical protein
MHMFRTARRSLMGFVAASVVAGCLVVVGGTPAQAALGSVSASLSNNQVSATGTYTFLFTTDLLAGTVALTLPAGVNVSGATTAVSKAATCADTFTSVAGTALANGQSVGLAPTVPIVAGQCVKIVVSNVVNPSSAGSLNACLGDSLTALSDLTALACSVGGALTGLVGGTATTVLTYVAQVTNGVTNDLAVAPVLTMAIDNATNSFAITPTASGVTASNSLTNVTVATNAQTYAVQAAVAGTSSVLKQVDGSATIPLTVKQATGGATADACDGSAVSLGANGTYNSVASSVAGLTNSKVTNVRYCWTVDLTKPAGTYTATITYLAVPTF